MVSGELWWLVAVKNAALLFFCFDDFNLMKL